jgi:Sulfotransferase domain
MFAWARRLSESHRYRRVFRPRVKTVGQHVRSLFRPPPADKRIIFVSGVQRSGTTLLLELLEQSPATQVFHEGSRAAFGHYMMRDLEMIRRLYERSPAAFVAMKALHEADRLPFLLDSFPDARAIWIYRRYDQVVASIMRKWPGGRNRVDEIVDDPTAGEWRGLGMSASTRRILIDHYRPDINDATAQALFWWWRNQLFFDLGLDEEDRVMLFKYEDLVKEPWPSLRKIYDFAGLEPNASMLRIIKTEPARTRDLPVEPAVRDLCDAQLRRFDARAGRGSDPVSDPDPLAAAP